MKNGIETLENEALLHNLFQQWEIKGVLFDLDDTLIESHEIFSQAIENVAKLYSLALPELDLEFLVKTLLKINAIAYQNSAVRRDRWNYVVKLFEDDLRNAGAEIIESDLEAQALEIFASIYTTEPIFEEGAERVLELMKEWELMVGLVTHANLEWTLFKLKNLGLDSYFDHLEIVDEYRLYKNSEDWLKAANGLIVPSTDLSIPVSNILAVGDSKVGDIGPAVEAKIGKVIWVDKETGWDLYRRGDLPKNAITVSGMSQLLELGTKRAIT